MSDDVPLYRACLTCGRLMPLQDQSKQVYCSPECSRENLQCPICGRYYEKGTGVVPPTGVEVCSDDCARVDRSYDSLFKELS
jgi:predicted nucleic acid-binding Zn ribbon protein